MPCQEHAAQLAHAEDTCIDVALQALGCMPGQLMTKAVSAPNP